MQPVSVGVDVAQASFTAAVVWGGTQQAWGDFANTPAGWAQWAARVQQVHAESGAPELLVTLEPTGGYELGLACFAYQQGWLVSRPNPRRVHDWRRSQGRRAKTDRLDALDLARYGAEQPRARWQPLPPDISELDSLLRRQDDLAQLLQQERNRQAALAQRPAASARVQASLAGVIASLEAALADIEQALQAHLTAHPRLQAQARLLRSVPGIGAKNVLVILVLLARWACLTDGQGPSKGLVAFTGLDPQTFSSGTSVRKTARISRMGERQTRRMLYMGALGGKSGHNPLRDFYQRLTGRGKAKKVALVACARKILIWAWAVYRTGTPFDAARHAPVPAAPA